MADYATLIRPTRWVKAMKESVQQKQMDRLVGIRIIDVDGSR